MSRTNHRRTDRPATLAARCVFLPLSSYIDAPRALSTEIFGWTHRPDEMAVVPWAGHPAQVIGSAVKEVECVEIVDLVVQDAAAVRAHPCREPLADEQLVHGDLS